VNLLLFDIDGTLTATSRDDDRFFREAVSEACETGAEVTAWEEFPDVTDAAIARVILSRATGKPARDRDLLHVREEFIKRWVRAVETGAVSIEPLPGAREILIEARARRDCVVAIITGGWAPTAILKLQTARLAVNGLVIATCEDDETRSSIIRSATIFAAAERGTPGFSSRVVIGDGIWDARAARSVGAGFLGVSADHAHAKRLLQEGAAAVIPDFSSPGDFWSGIDRAIVAARSVQGN